MLRLSVLLGVAMFVTLLIAGEDNGQMRPGLAAAIASGEEIVVIERRRAAEVPVAEPAVVVVAPVAEDAPAVIELASAPVEPLPEVNGREVTPEPVFTLSALPTVSRDAAEEPAAVTEAPAAGNGDVWYVTANSVNVREGPSTDAFIVDKLTRGEAVSISIVEGSEWAQVSIEGDGLEGYVALRFLSPEAP
jgi:uncharacterized protein YgiM (DUF1202 family)